MSELLPNTIEQSESSLVTAAKAGQYDAFEQLVNRYEHKIYRLGLNITGNPEDAEDVLQETFLKAFENLPRFREDSRFYTWIVRIGVNQALMKLRKRRTDKSVSLDEPIAELSRVTSPTGSRIPSNCSGARKLAIFWRKPSRNCLPRFAPCSCCGMWRACLPKRRRRC